MKLFSSIILILLFTGLLSFGQEDSVFKPNGKVNIEVYSDFYTGLTKQDNSSAFEIKRAYFGYKHELAEQWKAELKLDIGAPEDDSQYALLRRYAYFKTASLQYHAKKFKVHFGLIGLLQFKMQEKFWGRRYIYKSFQDEHKFGNTADIGVLFTYNLLSDLAIDATIVNGEGYKRLQSDNKYKSGLGISYQPGNLYSRFYIDYLPNEVNEYTLCGFLGYKKPDMFNIGAEYAISLNNSGIINQNKHGYSFFGTYIINNYFEIFLRYDILNSNILSNTSNAWNLAKDESAIITGVQYKPIKNIKMAINYQDWAPYAKNVANTSYIFFNIEFKI